MSKNLKELAINSFTNELAYSSSLEFDGVDSRVFVPYSASLNPASFTIEAWVKVQGGAGTFRSIVSSRDIVSSNFRGYTLYVNNSNKFDFFLGTGTSSPVSVVESVNVAPTNQWVHIAVSCEAGSQVMYVNGRQVSTGSSTLVANTARPLFIGAGQNESPANFYFNGLIGEVRFWSVVRSQEQIKANWSKRLRGDEVGLEAYWRMNDGSGMTATDSAGSNNGPMFFFPANPWSTSVPPIYQKTFQERYSEFVVSEFSSSINSGLGQATITIPKRLDNIGKAEKVGNEIEINVYDGEAPAGTLVYSGQIEEVRRVSGSNEEVQLVAEGHIRGFADDFVQNYSNQFRFDLASADLGTQFKTVLDYFNYHNPRSPISYDDADIATVGTSRIVNIDNQSYLDTLNQIREMAGANYYFYLGADNKMIFKTFNTSFDHIFTLQGDVVELDETTTISEVKNGLLFAGGSSNNRYYLDETSQFEYGRRIEQKKDERFTNTSSMDSFGNSFISIRKDPFDVINLSILDSNYDSSGFDIETVKPGDTLIMNNTGRTESTQLITNLTYSISTIQITTKDVRKFVEREVHELRERVERISYGGDGPQTYTTV